MPVAGILNFTGVSSKTLTAWTLYIREMLGQMTDEEDVKIGGPVLL